MVLMNLSFAADIKATSSKNISQITSHMADVTFHMKLNSMEVHHKKAEPWQVTLVDTGELTMTGGRLKRIRNYLDPTLLYLWRWCSRCRH